jgi:hypothetical protein
MSSPLDMMELRRGTLVARFRAPAVACLPPDVRRRDWIMRDWGGVLGAQHLLLAETLGLAMARRAAEILDRHRAGLTGGTVKTGDEEFAADNAIFTAVLDAANECLGRFDARPADDRWCDALLQLIQLAQVTDDEA